MQTIRHATLALASTALAACAIGPSETTSQPDGSEHGHLHHVHLNVTDIQKTTTFYGKHFGAVPVKYAGRAPALLAEQTFIFLDQKPGPIPTQLETGIIHIGWSGVDGPSEYALLQQQGIEFYTPPTPFMGGHYTYFYGPDREVIELWTVEKHHRLNHIHMPSPDPKATAEWFGKVINPEAPPRGGADGRGTWTINFGSVNMHILVDQGASRPKERTGDLKPTDDRELTIWRLPIVILILPMRV